MSEPLHPQLAPIAALVGTWNGPGRGSYPTIDPFEYAESVVFDHVGKPVLSYVQRTRDPEGRPLHAESGYWRCLGPGLVEAVIAHATGLVEVLEGEIDGAEIRLRSTTVAGTATAKSVNAVERGLTIGDETLTYDVKMAAVGEPLTHHLSAQLRRVR